MTASSPSRTSRSEDPSLSRRTFLDLTLSGAAALAAGGTLLSQAGRAFPAENPKKVRIAVVGGGFGASFHWHEHPNCAVTAVTDLYPQRRDALRNHYRCDNVYDSLEILLQKEKNVDAVAVFSGAVDHAKHVKACMERGLHVVSAVPVCTSLEDAAMLKELKEKTGLRYMMAESSWYRQECIFARNMFIDATPEELENHAPQFTVINMPNFHAVPAVDGTNSETFIIINFARKMRGFAGIAEE